MKPETGEWLTKAEGDWKVAGRESRAAAPVWDVICFLAQQCAEKNLKAYLEDHGIAFRKTHDLVLLLNSCGPGLRELEAHREQLAHLTAFGVAARYPGASADRQATREAMAAAKAVRAAVRRKLILDRPKANGQRRLFNNG
jgi:HEPN domain-containing protein